MGVPLRLLTLAVAAAWLAAPAAAVASGCSARSPDHRVALLELYTSEGCSSCPPADLWVSGLPAAGFAADRVVPLAFHVDYWNHLGWPDRFAQPIFTDRQRQLSAANRLGFLYTPAIALNGTLLRNLSHRRLRDALKEVNAQSAPAQLAIRALPEAKSVRVEVDARLRVPGTDAVVYLAVAESGLSTEVKRGENAGRLLRHDFVVREWRGPYPFRDGAAVRIAETLATADMAGAAGANLVALVQNRSTGEVLQALALPLCLPS